MSKITAYTALTTGFSTSDVVPIVDVSDTSMAATGTTKKITLANLQEAIDNDVDTNIQPVGAQASGTTGLNADAGHIHPAGNWMPADNGLLAANAPAILGGATTVLVVAGNLYVFKIWIRNPFTATNLIVRSATPLAAGTSTQSFCGLWNSSGTLLTGSADIGASFTATAGNKTLAFTTPQALTVSMGFVWAGFCFNMGTTQPTLCAYPGGSGQGPGVSNFGLTSATSAVGIAGTAITAAANFTPSAINQAGNATCYWAGIT
jgi:hypothetical protein